MCAANPFRVQEKRRKLPRVVAARSNPGLKLANAFGVKFVFMQATILAAQGFVRLRHLVLALPFVPRCEPEASLVDLA